MSDDQLRRPEDIIERVYQLAKQGKDATTPAIRDVYALIRQDRRELLERLKAQKVGYMDGGEWDAIPIDVINDELQHGAGLDEADHE